jgi:hypothetical protein
MTRRFVSIPDADFRSWHETDMPVCVAGCPVFRV